MTTKKEFIEYLETLPDDIEINVVMFTGEYDEYNEPERGYAKLEIDLNTMKHIKNNCLYIGDLG